MHGNAADGGDLRRHLDRRQDAALAGLGALAELELEHLHLIECCDLAQAVVVERAIQRAHPVFGGADLEDDIAAALQVIRRKAAFAGVQPASRHLRAPGERTHRRRRQRAVAHGRDVDDGGERIGVVGIRPDDHGRRGQGMLVERGKRAVDEDHRADGGQVPGRAEGDSVVRAGSRPIHPIALGAIERQLLPVEREEILPEELAKRREQGTKAADDGIVAPDGVAGLADIDDEHDENGKHKQSDCEDEQRGEERKPLHGQSAEQIHSRSSVSGAVFFSRHRIRLLQAKKSARPASEENAPPHRPPEIADHRFSRTLSRGTAHRH